MIEESAIQILKIVIPALSSFMGAFLAGGIAIYSSIKITKLSHKNSLKLLRQNAFAQTISKTYEEIVSIISIAIREDRVFNESELNKLGPLTLWIDEEIIDLMHLTMKEKELDKFKASSSLLIQKTRTLIGANQSLI